MKYRAVLTTAATADNADTDDKDDDDEENPRYKGGRSLTVGSQLRVHHNHTRHRVWAFHANGRRSGCWFHVPLYRLSGVPVHTRVWIPVQTAQTFPERGTSCGCRLSKNVFYLSKIKKGKWSIDTGKYLCTAVTMLQA